MLLSAKNGTASYIAARYGQNRLRKSYSMRAAPNDSNSFNDGAWMTSLSHRIAQLQAKELSLGFKAEKLDAVVEEALETRPSIDGLPKYSDYLLLTSWHEAQWAKLKSQTRQDEMQ